MSPTPEARPTRSKRPAIAAAIIGGVGALALFAHLSTAIQDCDHQATKDLARQVLSERLKLPFEMDSFAEVTAETTSARRVCRTRVAIKGIEPAEWLTFTLEPHGQDQVFLRYRAP